MSAKAWTSREQRRERFQGERVLKREKRESKETETSTEREYQRDNRPGVQGVRGRQHA